MSDDPGSLAGVWLQSGNGATVTQTVAPPWETDAYYDSLTFEQAMAHPGIDVWLVCNDGRARPILDLQTVHEDDDDGDLLYTTPQFLVDALGFDPRETMCEAERADEWRDVCRRARAARARDEGKGGLP